MAETLTVTLPCGVEHTLGLPLHPSLAKQIENGTLKLVDGTAPPEVAVGGEGGAERGSAPPPVDPNAAPAGNASRDEWEAYAVRRGVDAAEATGMKREDLKAHVDEIDKAAEQDSGA